MPSLGLYRVFCDRNILIGNLHFWPWCHFELQLFATTAAEYYLIVSTGICHLLHLWICSSDDLPVHVQCKWYPEWLHRPLAVLLQCEWLSTWHCTDHHPHHRSLCVQVRTLLWNFIYLDFTCRTEIRIELSDCKISSYVFCYLIQILELF